MANKKRRKGGVKNMAEGPIGKVLALAMWLVGILVSLAVGFGMKDGILSIPIIGETIVMVAGWIVIVLTLASVVLGIVDRF
jgi:hypothetical protein